MPRTVKPRALHPHDAIRVLSPASPVKPELLQKGCDEIARLGYSAEIDRSQALARESYFAGTHECRRRALERALSETETRAIFCSRGGYGSNYLVENLNVHRDPARILLGSSDVTSLQVYLWQKFGWVTFYGPMVASNFQNGAGQPHGYDGASLARALTETTSGWELNLEAESLAPGEAEGVLLGGCLTLIEATLGTPWELDTRGAILLLEDRGMKPYQVDRALMHLKQAGKFEGVKGIVLGDFPDCEAPNGGETVGEVVQRVLASVFSPVFSPDLAPIVWGAPVGHTERATLTIPLGVRARLEAPERNEFPKLQILDPACVA